jgi:OmpA-OmpF porin, OOP family
MGLRPAVALLTCLVLAGTARGQAADPDPPGDGDAAAEVGRREIAGFLGPRVFSEKSALGDKGDADTSLRNSVELGPRLGLQLFPWLAVEAEVALAITSTRDYDVDVFTFDPRGHARFDLPHRGPLRPFFVAGAGVPIVLSSKRGLYGSDLTWEVYGGAGLRFEPERGVNLRADTRVLFLPGRGDTAIAAEWELTVSAYWPFGADTDARRRRVAVAEIPDSDGDGLRGTADACPDRPEDVDQYEDEDGCPEIDDDLDGILDLDDKCRNVAETHNGFDDEDGCPDTVPDDVAALEGPIPRLFFAAGSAVLRPESRQSLDRIAATLAKYPTTRIRLLGHTDTTEVPPPPNPDDDASAGVQEANEQVLSLDRAEAVKTYLVDRGIRPYRLEARGLGREAPLADNATPRGRLTNRRVDLQLRVPETK